MSFGVHCGISDCTAKHKPTLFGAEGDCIISPPKTPAQRVADSDARKIAAGMKKIGSLWSYPECFPEIRAAATRITERARKRAKEQK